MKYLGFKEHVNGVGDECDKRNAYPTRITHTVETFREQLCPEWEVVLMSKPPEWDPNPAEYEAVSECLENARVIRIFISPHAWVDEGDLTVTIVHELLHAVFRDMKDAFKTWDDDLYDRMEERTIERIARAFVGAPPGTEVK